MTARSIVDAKHRSFKVNEPRQDRRAQPRAQRSLRPSTRAALTSAAALILVIACSESSTPDTTSTFEGALALDTFPTSPDGVQATNDQGTVAPATVDAAGNFTIELSRGHSYELAVRSGSERISIVFPRASGQLSSKFDVTSGAARVSLGAVRYFAAAPPGGFALKSARLGSETAGEGADEADGEIGECVNGMIVGSGAVCVDDDGDVACEGEASDGDGECQDGIDATTGKACSDPAEPSDGDGECEDGTDSVTGLACTDPPDGSDGDGECENGTDSTTGQPCVDPEEDSVDPNGPMAIAEHNVPDQVGGCDEGGEEEEDD
jgi:hypothetical protein